VFADAVLAIGAAGGGAGKMVRGAALTVAVGAGTGWLDTARTSSDGSDAAV
jgi:hypothetical protein